MSKSAFILCLAFLAFRPIAPQDVQGQLLAGVVAAKETGRPLDHAMVSVLAAQRQMFTSESGVFAFANVPPGTYKVRIASLGYTPIDIEATVPAEGAPDRIQVQLSLISTLLPTIRVSANGACTDPGLPDPVIEPDFAAVMGQLRINAQQYRLLADSFPFSYRLNRTTESFDGTDQLLRRFVDTVAYTSNNGGWRYRVGGLVARTTSKDYDLHLPTLGDVASADFLDNHCFHFAGRKSAKGGPVLQIDFRVADRITSSDVNGSIFLDAKSYQVRRMVLDLSRVPGEASNISTLRVETSFAEIAPHIAVFKEIIGTTHSAVQKNWRLNLSTIEDQVMFEFKWLRSAPGKGPSTP